MTHPLDNTVWNALTGPWRALGEHRGRAARFESDVSVFSGVDDPNDAAAFDDLRDLICPGHVAVLFAPELAIPDGWSEAFRYPCHQLVATDVDIAAAPDDLLPLGVDDVPEMLELVERTKPGPFAPRTIELGGYVGVRDDAGRLVAMAGERLRVDGFSEVSAVCTLEEVRGQGLATKLVLAVVAGIRARGEEAFLHVATDNTNALRLYLAMGFVERIRADALGLRAPG